MSENKFKIGDKVRLIEGGCYHRRAGEIGEVRKVNDGYFAYYVVFNYPSIEGKYDGAFHDDELELVNNEI